MQTPVTLDVNITGGSLTGMAPLVGTFGQVLAARVEITADGSGSGALVNPIIDTDPSSSNYGKITGFTVVDGGSNYESDTNFTLKIIPVIRSVNQGIEGQLEYASNPPNEANANYRVDTIVSARNPDNSLMLGSGYVISPRLRLFPGSFGIVGNDRVPLELTDQPTSRVQPVNESIILDADSFINSGPIGWWFYPVSDLYLSRSKLLTERKLSPFPW